MSDAASIAHDQWRPRANPWFIAVAVMLATFMVILDTTITVVALPYIAGNLGATQDESTWVLTSYLVANAIILPASTWFSGFFGRKKFLIACTVIFTGASLICGLATSMNMLVLSRVLQGIGGGAMQPLSQAILLESFPPAKRGAATALFGIAIVVAPIVGPTLGGWLTDNWSWRWTFYINLPVGIIAIFLMFLLLEDPPWIHARRDYPLDRLGFGLVALFLGTLQIILDKGQDDDWFGAIWLRWFTVICVVCLIGFIVHELHVAHPLVDLRILKNRNFRVSCILFALFGLTLYALLAIQPLFLQSLLGYNAFKSGLSVCPRGIGSFAALFFVGALASKVDSRLLTGLGFAFIAISSFLLCRLTLQVSMSCLVVPNIMSGFGTGCLFVPLTTLAVGTLRNEQIGNAIGLQNLIRNIGGSVGLALVSTFQQRLALAHQNFLVAQLSPLNPQYQQRIAAVQHIFAQRFNPTDALAHARGMLYNTMIQQSNYWSFMDVFFLVACACVVSVLFVPLFSKPRVVHAVAAGE
ncbi:MAG TPA: DHA2 family efflux MFS transporter permease subunit [Candidatus Acidoferrales bacterium]|jgi:DHA2 family multidrug resistance protein|nr:DHA2 family efflux MFS transporter permease subunit [Candidatus Acidoferrales bacterium]